MEFIFLTNFTFAKIPNSNHNATIPKPKFHDIYLDSAEQVRNYIKEKIPDSFPVCINYPSFCCYLCSLQNSIKPFCLKNAPKKLIYVYQKDIVLSKYGYGNNTHSIEDLKNSRLGIKNLYLFWLKMVRK